MKQFHRKNYNAAEQSLKEALGIIKKANQEQSLGYCFILTRLAYTCYMSRKYAESEKYFRVCNELVPRVTKNPVNLFNAKRNLLTLYTYSDIGKAQ